MTTRQKCAKELPEAGSGKEMFSPSLWREQASVNTYLIHDTDLSLLASSTLRE